MMLLKIWHALLARLGPLWYECGDDLGVFCYRIGCGLFTAARQRAVELAPLATTRNLTRTNAACLNPSFTFSARFTTPKD